MDIERIKALLKERNMSFDDLVQKMGKERSVVYKTITNGNPTLKFLQQLSKALDLPIDDIINSDKVGAVQKTSTGTIDGFVEVNGAIFRIRTREDLNELCNRLNNA